MPRSRSLLALEHDGAVGQACNISNDRPLSQRQFLDAVAREIGAAPPRLRVPYRALYAIAYSAERLAKLTRSSREPVVTRHGVNLFGTDNRHAIDKARNELGYRPRMPLDEGIRNAAALVSGAERAPPTGRSGSVSLTPLESATLAAVAELVDAQG